MGIIWIYMGTKKSAILNFAILNSAILKKIEKGGVVLSGMTERQKDRKTNVLNYIINSSCTVRCDSISNIHARDENKQHQCWHHDANILFCISRFCHLHLWLNQIVVFWGMAQWYLLNFMSTACGSIFVMFYGWWDFLGKMFFPRLFDEFLFMKS